MNTATLPDLGHGTLTILLGVAAALGVSTLIRAARLLRSRDAPAIERLRSVGSWWLLFLGLVSVLVLGRPAVLAAMAGISVALLHETLRLTGTRRHLPIAGGLGVTIYAAAWFEWRTVFVAVLPGLAVGALALAVGRKLRPSAEAPRRRAAIPGTAFAFLISVVGPSYVVGTALLPPGRPPSHDALGWLVLLLLLTELNDIAQAWWGRAVGSRPLAPTLSPGKTWEGMAGGVVTTAATAVLLAPTLTSWGAAVPPVLPVAGPAWIGSACLGALVAGAGLLGDLSASVLKRRAGVKDSGTALPGQGGLLDRFDSLAVAAPVYFFLTYALWIRP